MGGTSKPPVHVAPVAPVASTTSEYRDPYPEKIKNIVLSFPENTLDTSDWLTYRSEELGFELKYPKDWEVLRLEYGNEIDPTIEDGKILNLGAIAMRPKNKPYSPQGSEPDIYRQEVERTNKK